MTEKYDDTIIKAFTIASLFWGVIAMFMGVWIALELTYPLLNFDLPWTSFGRLRPIHTTGIIFGFGGNVLFATSFYILQRTCEVRLRMATAAKFLFLGYQVFLILAVAGYPLGITQGKEYAEPEWYADLLLTVLWILYFIIYLVTLHYRKERHIYVSNWFYLAFIFVFSMLHIGNGLAIPLALNSPNSVPLFGGVQSAMIQWWYGHNAVGFFLTAGFIGIMYYFIPKRAEQPVYSYRLSILHFWALIFLYIWAGAHHLHYTAVPDWTQTLGMTMSIILWVPSWGGMINGIMTLSGSWHKVRQDPVLAFLVIAVAFYGMSTFEGPVLSIKEVNRLAHYSEWIISHVHSGGLGWVGFISFGALYHMVPILWNKPALFSMKLVSLHLWLASIGIVFYITSMWAAGITQGLLWRSYNEVGFLKYAFIEIVALLHPYYLIRAIGGLCYLSGFIIMIYNLYKTIKLQPAKSNEKMKVKITSAEPA
jgi:cytochrome c oxidase cbb3-type subunit 1